MLALSWLDKCMSTTTTHIARSARGSETHKGVQVYNDAGQKVRALIACSRTAYAPILGAEATLEELADQVTCSKCAANVAAKLAAAKSVEHERAERYEAIAAKHRAAGDIEEAEAWERSAAAWRESA